MKVLMSVFFIIVIVFTLTESSLAAPVPRIQVNAILNNAAVLTINGSQQMLKKNAHSKEGYKLVDIGSDKVTLLISGKAMDFKLGAAISSSRDTGNASRIVRIGRDQQGMYSASGAINDHSVNFLVDTGASFIAINSKLANQMGLDYKLLGKPSMANTASGQVKAWKLMLTSVSVGEVQLHLVEAAVIEGDFPIKPLLGMSFLSRVKMQDDGLLLTLEEIF